ncbi:MAG: bifunctional tetrahydrofolate synthase/dihydrofolate synthase, partial [Burkholderiaceae bacterium]|nr:bifunctional tetrahydrofolate synthase/dihydrofolate synthase [Burkholderiaceae bacterium]
MPHSLSEWLDWAERVHPRGIAMGLDRVRAVARSLGIAFECPVITVGGTNGKGSTCAMLESILLAAGFKVALHTSPHLLEFNERARFLGESATDDALAMHMAAVEQARGDVQLTYLEFRLLAILRWFQSCQPDVVILEVGLGGRLDAVNLIDADCSIVTCVDIDHVEYLGGTRDTIGWEKAHIFRTGRPAICADPVPPVSLLDYAREIGADLRLFGRDFNYSGDRQQWSYGGRDIRRSSLAYPALRGANQLLNASGVLAALEALRDRLPVSQQAVRQGLATVELPGRFQVLPGRPAIVLDVAHNPHAAAHLASNLDNMGFFTATWAVFGAMRDKDLAGIIGHLRERVDHWLPVALPGARAAGTDELMAALARAGAGPDAQRTVEPFATPREALVHAQSRAEEGDRIVVFGSFLTVADVLAW